MILNNQKTNYMIMTVGYPASGKTTFVQKLSKKIKLNVINGDLFRDFLQEKILYFDNVLFYRQTNKTKEASDITKKYKQIIVNFFVNKKINFLLEGNYLDYQRRKKIIQRIKKINPNLKIIIIFFEIEEDELIYRYKKREEEKKEATWIKDFYNYRKSMLNIPTEQEGDFLLRYNQNNANDVIREIQIILSSG